MNLSQPMKPQARSGVVHATLNPDGTGFVRLHLVGRILHVNGEIVIPLSPAETRLVTIFIEELKDKAPQGEEISDAMLENILDAVALRMGQLYKKVSPQVFKDDAIKLVGIFVSVARGQVPDGVEIPFLTMEEYAAQATAPDRMDLIVSPMVKDGHPFCPLDCRNCYAKQTAMNISSKDELSTAQWKAVIDCCWQVGIYKITFTGGEPTMRRDLAELVAYAEQFITTVNTSGATFNEEMAQKLREASLDAVQFTLYSSDPQIHDHFVGEKGAFFKTVDAIAYAQEAGLNVSVNTPLCTLNRDYLSLLMLLKALGVTYVSCSGLIPTGGAVESLTNGGALSKQEIYDILTQAVKYCRENELELAFTSPGWLTEAQSDSLDLPASVCGACSSNMAVTPTGAVVACQSWLSDPKGLGYILTTPWSEIWNHPTCARIRATASLKNHCPLNEEH